MYNFGRTIQIHDCGTFGGFPGSELLTAGSFVPSWSFPTKGMVFGDSFESLNTFLFVEFVGFLGRIGGFVRGTVFADGEMFDEDDVAAHPYAGPGVSISTVEGLAFGCDVSPGFDGFFCEFLAVAAGDGSVPDFFAVS